MTRRGSIIVAALAAAALGGAAAGAATQTQTFTRTGVSDVAAFGTGGSGASTFDGIEAALFDGATFNPFDTSLGTLLAATVRYDFTLSITGQADYYVAFDPVSGGFYDGSYAISYALDFVQFAPSGGPGDSAALSASGARAGVPVGTAPPTAPISTTTSLVGTAALDLGQAAGPDPFTFEVNGLASLSGFFVEIDAQAAFDGTIAVTYTYDDGTPPPIPLPAGLPLLLASLAALGAVRAARRSR